MKSLGINWFTEGYIDFEHKKYVLLDYLQEINRHFGSSRLYPNLSDLLFHYNNLLTVKNNKTAIQQSFPQKLNKADMQAVKLTYQKIIDDDNSMKEIERIISYAIAKMDPAIQTGREIYDFVESRINIDPVGLVPLLPYFGYFSLQNGKNKTSMVYEYQLSIFENQVDKYRGMNVQFLDTFEMGIVNTPEALKLNLVKTRKHLPNPAVYHVQSDITFPLEQTLLPVAKKCLLKYIAAA